MRERCLSFSLLGQKQHLQMMLQAHSLWRTRVSARWKMASLSFAATASAPQQLSLPKGKLLQKCLLGRRGFLRQRFFCAAGYQLPLRATATRRSTYFLPALLREVFSHAFFVHENKKGILENRITSREMRLI